MEGWKVQLEMEFKQGQEEEEEEKKSTISFSELKSQTGHYTKYVLRTTNAERRRAILACSHKLSLSLSV